MLSLITRAILLSISSGFSCIAYCLPVTIPIFLSTEHPGIKESLKYLVFFLTGRLTAYLFFGMVFGFLGKALASISPFRMILIPTFYLFLGILLIIYALVNIPVCKRLPLFHLIKPKINSIWFIFILGVIMGISPCPPFLLALASALEMGKVLNGVLFFLFFFLGSTIFFLPLIFTSFLTRYNEVRFAARIVAIFTGLYFISLGIRNLL